MSGDFLYAFLIALRQSLPELEVTVSSRLAGPWALGICLCHLPVLGYRHPHIKA